MGSQGIRFSVIVPTRDRPAQLRNCLQALAALKCAREGFEVIVVDDGGSAELDCVLAPFCGRLDLKLHRLPPSGPATARNAGAALARGRFLAFTDDDCAPAPDWLEALERRLLQHSGCAVGGQTINGLSGNLYACASQMLVDFLYSYYNRSPAQARMLTSNNLAFPAERFRAVGGFDPAFRGAGGEDRDLCDRWLGLGYQMVYAPEAVVHHFHALTGGGFWRQHISYGRGAATFHEARTRRGQGPIRVEPLSFYLGICACPFRGPWGWRAWPLAALLICSQVANAAGFFWEKAVGHRRKPSR
jgi:GT2 family glycosyltransferase